MKSKFKSCEVKYIVLLYRDNVLTEEKMAQVIGLLASLGSERKSPTFLDFEPFSYLFV